MSEISVFLSAEASRIEHRLSKLRFLSDTNIFKASLKPDVYEEEAFIAERGKSSTCS